MGETVFTNLYPDGRTIELPPQFLSRFPPSFWEILDPSRSPKLRRLNFESDKLRSFDFNPLFKLKLPSLQVLAIGTFIFSDFTPTDLVSFLTSSSKLQHLEISQSARIPWQDINLNQLRHYGGNVFTIMAGAAHWPSLRALDISSFPLSFVRMTNFVRKSSKLPLLKFLKLRVTSEDNLPFRSEICKDSDPALELIPALACCYSGLEELHMINSVGSTLPWVSQSAIIMARVTCLIDHVKDSILLSLARFRDLERFHLSQTPSLFNRSTLQFAWSALCSNHKLEQVVVCRSAGPWLRTCDYKIDEKVTVRPLRLSNTATVHRINYQDNEYVSSSRSIVSLPC
jgi:hypothetical protein